MVSILLESSQEAPRQKEKEGTRSPDFFFNSILNSTGKLREQQRTTDAGEESASEDNEGSGEMLEVEDLGRMKRVQTSDSRLHPL